MDMGKYVGLAMCLARLPPDKTPGPCTEAVVVSSYTTLGAKEGVHAPQCWLHAVEIVSPHGASTAASSGYAPPPPTLPLGPRISVPPLNPWLGKLFWAMRHLNRERERDTEIYFEVLTCAAVRAT